MSEELPPLGWLDEAQPAPQFVSPPPIVVSTVIAGAPTVSGGIPVGPEAEDRQLRDMIFRFRVEHHLLQGDTRPYQWDDDSLPFESPEGPFPTDLNDDRD